MGDSIITLDSPDINYAGWGWYWTTNTNHVFWLNGLGATDGAGQKIRDASTGAITPIQAYALDLKYDDGITNKGKIISGKYAAGAFACDLNTASYSATNASYKNLVVYSMMFDAGF